MEPFHQCLALGPVAIYLVLLGVINLARRPLVVSGGATRRHWVGRFRAGLRGADGPAFSRERGGPFRAGGHKYLWLMFIGLLAICLIMVLLILRPRLIIYNISVDQFRPILAEVVERMDADARWAGDCLFLPGLGVQLHLESFGWMRNVSLVSSGPKQDYQGWSRLGVELAAALRGIEVPRNLAGLMLLSVGNVSILGLAWAIIRDPQAIARTVFELLDVKRGAIPDWRFGLAGFGWHAFTRRVAGRHVRSGQKHAYSATP